MSHAETGHYVKIHYTVKLRDGRTVGRSPEGRPLGFVIGKGKVFSALEQGVLGMHAGQTRRIELSPVQAYGQRRPDRMIRVNKQELPTLEDIKVGRTVQYMDESGVMVNFLIIAVDQDTVTLDANHPLAGLDLIYEVTLLAVEDPL